MGTFSGIRKVIFDKEHLILNTDYVDIQYVVDKTFTSLIIEYVPKYWKNEYFGKHSICSLGIYIYHTLITF